MSKITDALVQSYNSVSNLWNPDKINYNLAENKDILELGNILNGLFINKNIWNKWGGYALPATHWAWEELSELVLTEDDK